MANWSKQLYWEDVFVGQDVPAVAYPISVYRLVVEAAANRDFNSIHHNSAYAQKMGSPDMFANTFFLQGMWERMIREFIGVHGRIKSISDFRMRDVNTVGEIVVVKGKVKGKRAEGPDHLVDLEIWSENSRGVSVGPGTVTVALPSR